MKTVNSDLTYPLILCQTTSKTLKATIVQGKDYYMTSSPYAKDTEEK